MPKISALTSLAQASVDTAADVLPIVDATAPATTKKVTVQAMVNAGLATLTTLPSGIVNASLSSITPAGGTLAVTGNVGITGDASAGIVTASSRVVTDDINARTATRVSINNAYGTSLATFDHSTGLSSFNFGAAVTGIQTITANSLSPALVVTQNGGGYALIIPGAADQWYGLVGDLDGKHFRFSGTAGTGYALFQTFETGIGATGSFVFQRDGGTVLIGTGTDNGVDKLQVTGSISATSLVDISAAGAGQIKFPATQNASADANTLDDYQEATYTGTATGMTTSPTGTVSYTLTGNEATLNLPEITGTSNATTFTVTGMPAEARPATRKTVLGRAQDNGGAIVPVRIDIETTGVLTIYANADAGAFTASGSKTLAECSVTYTRV